MQMMMGMMLGRSLLGLDFREKEKALLSSREEPRKAIPIKTRTCSKCQAAVGDGDNFCSSCGTKLE